jgi:hypothetical protein
LGHAAGFGILSPRSWLLDRFGLRRTTATIVASLAAVVWCMSEQAGGVGALFVLVLLTRALGQNALSVASITVVGKSAPQRAGMAMGIYSVLLSVFFAVDFVVIGGVVSENGWRAGWARIAFALVVFVVPMVIFLRQPAAENAAVASSASPSSASRASCLGQSSAAGSIGISGKPGPMPCAQSSSSC